MGLPFAAEMLESQKGINADKDIPADSLNRYHENLKQQANTQQIGKGRQHLKPAMCAAIGSACKQEMAQFGYEASHRPSGQSRIVAQTYPIIQRAYRMRLGLLNKNRGAA